MKAPIPQNEQEELRSLHLEQELTCEEAAQEERLRQSQEILNGISASCPAGIYQADLKGQATYANRRAQEIWCMDEQELLGAGWTTRIHPEDLPGLTEAWTQASAAGLPYEREFRLTLPDGSVRWVHGRSSVIRDRTGMPVGTAGTVDDITQRKQLEEEQHASQELTRRILESSADCINVIDLQGQLLLMSPNGMRAFGIQDSAAFIGRNYFELWKNAEDREAAEAAFQKAVSGEVASFQGYSASVGNQLQWWDTVFSPIVDKAGIPGRILAVSRDLTQFRRTSEEHERARHLAEAANRAKSLFLANVSHELRTPLNGVLATSDVLLGTRLDEEQRELAETIQNSGRALLSVVNDLLDLSRMEAGKLEFHYSEFDIRETVQQAVELTAPAAREKQLAVSIDYPACLPGMLIGDANRIGQILVNYLNNAVKFTDRGSVVIHVRAEVSDDGTIPLLIAVRDSGRGIAEEAQTNLFKPFHQVDGSSTRKYGGLGLGLAISARLAEAMGGSTGVKSSLGQGSTFWLRLTLQAASQEQSAAPNPPVASAVFDGLRVLVAEDNPINQKVILRLLDKLGCKPDLAANGEAAVDLYTRERYAIVLMDCQMPELDGYQATQKIRQVERAYGLSRTPIVAVTAHGMTGDREQSLAAGMDDHLVKPLGLDSLRSALEKWQAVACS